MLVQERFIPMIQTPKHGPDRCTVLVFAVLLHYSKTYVLTTVGGRGEPFTNKLYSLTGNASESQWSEEFPPMPTKRKWTTVICSNAKLIVAGGMTDVTLRTVEVLNAEEVPYTWSTATSLPSPFHRASAAICNGRIFMLGGSGEGEQNETSVLTCQLKDLLQSSTHSDTNACDVWSRIADLPVSKSTCASLGDQLLAIGGKEADDKFSSDVYTYDLLTDSWKIVSQLSIARCSCFAAVLSNDQIMVLGGWIKKQHDTDSVEIGKCVKDN